MVRLQLVHIVEEVFEFPQLLWPPLCRITEEDRFNNRIILEIVINVFDLVDEVLLYDWVNCCVGPAEATRPEYQRVELIFTVPALLVFSMKQAPLAHTRYIWLMTKLSFNDEFALVFGQLSLIFTVFNLLFVQLPHPHLFLHLELIMILKASLYSMKHRTAFEVDSNVQSDLAVGKLWLAADSLVELSQKGWCDALIPRQVHANDTSRSG